MILTGDDDLIGAEKATAPTLTITAKIDYFEKIKAFPRVPRSNIQTTSPT
ncbi:MAG: hypothetical protein Ct9H300mP29_0090 [Candidatus Neomarinimicrobiota bacterium]|nr:MAG: hypothetical protein Ct9H300mP29_0090 [Candidatus Neomarinimicrobiota bacterium]